LDLIKQAAKKLHELTVISSIAHYLGFASFFCVWLFSLWQGRLLTGAMIALAIGGGAYVSTADEGKFWCVILSS